MSRAAYRVDTGSRALNASLVLAGLVVAALVAPWPVRVVDGDTIDRGLFRYRLVGFDAPETRRARCVLERERGHAATARLRELIAGAGEVEIRRETWRLDRYWRLLGRLYVDGRDVGEIAIAEGWGAPYHVRKGKQRDWCA